MLQAAEELPDRLKQLLAHWHGLRQGNAIPTLTDFLDRPAPKLQPWVGIFDIESETSWPVRLAGTEVGAFYNLDFTGLDFADIISDEARPVFQFSLPEICRSRCGLYHLNRCGTSSGRQFHLHVLGLPLVRPDLKPSVVWTIYPEERLGTEEIGLPVRNILTQKWIDLGHGVPSKFVDPQPSRNSAKTSTPYAALASQR
jgi:hypothetical protein